MRQYTISLERVPQAWREEIIRNKKALNGALLEMGKNAVRILQEASPEDQGVFKDSWYYTQHSNGVDVINDAPHAAFVEDGTPPHWPPPIAIRVWIERNKHRLHGIPIDPVTPEEYKQVTYLICRKIATQGTPPLHLLKKRQGAFIYLLRHYVEKHLKS